MRELVTSSHRRGTRVDFLPRAQGPFADWAEVQRAADGEAADAVLAGTRVVARRRDANDRAHTQDLSLAEAASLRPDDLGEVRRPVSYRGMRNYIGRTGLPSQLHEGHAGWFESRNEQENYRNLLIEQPVVQMGTQPLRLEWPLRSGIRTHVPDALYLTVDERVVLVDVTRRSRLLSPEAVAIFRLAQLTARAMGWDYELRGELTAQHQRNVSMIYSHRHETPTSTTWRAHLRTMPADQQVTQAADAFGTPRRPNYAAVWHLVATRHLFLDLSAPLTRDSIVQRRPHPTGSNPCLIQP